MFLILQPYGNALSIVACFLFILIICEFSEQISGDSRGQMRVAWTSRGSGKKKSDPGCISNLEPR